MGLGCVHGRLLGKAVEAPSAVRPSVGGAAVCRYPAYVLKFAHPDWVPMQTRQAGLEGTGEIRLRELVKPALRMRPYGPAP